MACYKKVLLKNNHIVQVAFCATMAAVGGVFSKIYFNDMRVDIMENEFVEMSSFGGLRINFLQTVGERSRSFVNRSYE